MARRSESDQSDVEVASDDRSTEVEAAYRPPWGPVGIVLVVEVCERLTYYTLAGSQKIYLNKRLGYTASSAAAVNSVFSMLCYMWCLPGGLVADVIGRYKVIVSLASTYALGALMVAISTTASMQKQLKSLFLIGALGFIPFGTGGIKPNICNFGADQIGDDTEGKKEAQKKFFSYFYMAVNVGVVGAFGYMANVTTHGIPGLVPLEQGYFVAYVVAAMSMVVAVGLFVAGTKCYSLLPGGGIEGATTMVSSVVHSARSGGDARAYVALVGWLSMPMFFVCTIAATVAPAGGEPAATAANVTLADPFPNYLEEACGMTGARHLLEAASARRLHGGAVESGAPSVRAVLSHTALFFGCLSCSCLVLAHRDNSWIQPLPARRMTAFTVGEVRSGFAAVPLIIVVNLAFNMAYNAMNNAFPSQACQMNTMLGGSQLNGAFFTLADGIAIVALTPVFESVVYPLVQRAKGSPVRVGQKLIAGLLIAACANGLAAWLEVSRRRAPLMCREAVSECAPNGIHMRDMSAFWMFIPFGLIGASEILVNPCMYYFAYVAAPPKVRSLVQAFNLFFQGSVSNAFTAVAMSSAFPDDLDTGNLEIYYFINVVCALLGVVAYFYLTRCGSNAEETKIDMRDEETDPTEHVSVGSSAEETG